jgi:hypothetical protein
MKKISLLSLLGLAWVFSFLAIPAFAQEEAEDIAVETEDVIVDDWIITEDVAAEDISEEDIYNAKYWEEEDAVAVEDSETDELVKAIAEDPETVQALNQWADEVLEAIWDAELTESFNALFNSDEERAAGVAWIVALFMGLWAVYLIIALICLLIFIIAGWVAFNKAWEKGWKILIPIYNVYIMYKIAWYKNLFWWTIIISLVFWIAAWFAGEYEMYVQLASYVIVWLIGIFVNYKFARSYGWGVFTSILYVLFTPICLLFLAFWGCKYIGNKWEKTEVIEA